MANHTAQTNKIKKTQALKSDFKSNSHAIPAIVFNSSKSKAAEQKSDKPAKKTPETSDQLKKDTPPLPSNSGPRYTFSTEIPESYNECYICALQRDPQWLYVYWELPGGVTGSLSHVPLEKPAMPDQMVLKIRDTTETDVPVSTQQEICIPVEKNCSNWYVKVPRPGHIYQVDYGRINSNGNFTPISSAVSTPLHHSRFISAPSETESEQVQTQKLIDYSLTTPAIQHIARKTESGTEQISNGKKALAVEQAERENDTSSERYFGSAAYS